VPTRINDGELAPLQPPDVVNGAALYAEKCVACHGTSGAGDGPRAAQLKAQNKIVASLVGQKRRGVKPSEWHDVITNGRIQNLMPPFSGSLNAQQRWDVQAYVWALGTTSQTLMSGSQMFVQQCAACHEGGQAPRLDDLNKLAQTSLIDLSSAMASGAQHSALTLDEAQRFTLAEYVRSLAYRYADPEAIRNAALVGEGQLLLQAANATLPPATFANSPATLRVYDTTGGGEVFSRTVNLDANGFVSFTQLPQRADYFYQAELLHDGVKFYAPPQQLFTTTQVVTGLLPVYEVSNTPDAISVPEMYYFVQDVGESGLSVVEVYFFDNKSDKAFVQKVGNTNRSLRFSLPEDARNVRFDPPQFANRVTISGTEFFYNDLVEPGERTTQVTLLYDIPYREGKRITRQLAYPITNFNVLLAEMKTPGTPLTVTGLVNRGLQTTPNGNFILFASDKPVPANTPVSFDISGQPRAVAQVGADGASIGFGLLALALALGASYLVFTRVNKIRAAQTQPIKKQREQLLQALAALDADYREGKLKDEYYQRRRGELKDELREIWE
jgi:mono/diheme cytochrome c family protein